MGPANGSRAFRIRERSVRAGTNAGGQPGAHIGWSEPVFAKTKSTDDLPTEAATRAQTMTSVALR
jgi:hypothetical protein